MSGQLNIDLNSCDNRSVRITAWCLRFANNVKAGQKKHGILSVDELRNANNIWIKYIQNKNFYDAINVMSGKKKNPLVSRLGLIIDEHGLLRCKGRFASEDKSPILLPKKEHYTKLVIVKYHKNVLHAGVSQKFVTHTG